MRIVLVIPTLNQGGAERVMSILANEWILDENEVHLVLLAKSERFYSLNNKVIIHELGFSPRQNKFRKIFLLIKNFFDLRKTIKQINPDFTLSFMNKYNVFTLLSTLMLNQKVVVSERDSPTEKIPFITDFLRKYTYKLASGVICQTEQSKKFIEEETKSKNVISIPNPIKEVSIDEKIKKEKIILSVGRLVPKKGHKYLIEAFSKIEQNDWKILILGDGPLKNALIKDISFYNLEEKIILKGSVKDVDIWLNKASIFVFPSVLEGYPNALAEAMIAGLPCISFDCNTGPRDIIKNGKNGFLIEERNVDELSKSISKLINSEPLRNEFSKEALKLKSIVNKESVSKGYLNFCKECIS